MNIDLHCHSKCSDGDLSFQALLIKAASLKLDALAITDHDTLQGYQEYQRTFPQHTNPLDTTIVGREVGREVSRDAHSASTHPQPKNAQSLSLFTGVEISSQWQGIDIHIVGLDVALNHQGLLDLLQQQNDKRIQRAQVIAKKLAGKGIDGALEGARHYAQQAHIARPHFAKYLVEQGFAKDTKQAFDRYLGQGKSCYQSTPWPDVAESIAHIKAAGGLAVLAHPTRYRLTASKLRRLVAYFSERGGDALEFIGGTGHQDAQAFIQELCEKHQLLGSPASDFHSERQPWQRLGHTGTLPQTIQGVWEGFGTAFATIPFEFGEKP